MVNNHLLMLRNLLVVAYRGITRNLSYTLINVLGLSAGLSACLVIFLVVKFELSFDTFHENSDRLFRVTRASSNASGLHHSAITPYPFAAAFRNDFNDIPLNTQFHYHEEVQATIGTEKYKAAHILYPDIFIPHWSIGNPKKSLPKEGMETIMENRMCEFAGGSFTIPTTSTSSLLSRVRCVMPGFKIFAANVSVRKTLPG